MIFYIFFQFFEGALVSDIPIVTEHWHCVVSIVGGEKSLLSSENKPTMTDPNWNWFSVAWPEWRRPHFGCVYVCV
jgi:hypothetical protein